MAEDGKLPLLAGFEGVRLEDESETALQGLHAKRQSRLPDTPGRGHVCLRFALLVSLAIAGTLSWLAWPDKSQVIGPLKHCNQSKGCYWEGGWRRNLSAWILQEQETALGRILNNIGPAIGALDGIVVASPSRGEVKGQPNYYFTWTRDSALTISALQSKLTGPFGSPIEARLFEAVVRDYVSSQAVLQGLSTRSGNLRSGGLNEPKFNVDLTPFDGNWGRPQRDGPALRAIALIPYANMLLDRGWPADIAYVREKLYNPSTWRSVGLVIKNDLEEVANGWAEPGFDLWEEVYGHHLFTRLVSLRALDEGADLADRLNDAGAAAFYRLQAATLSADMPSFLRNSTPDDAPTWVASLLASGGPVPGRTGLDCAIPLSIVQSAGRLSPADPDTLNSLWRYIRSFEGLYPINNGTWIEGWALGRYVEDVYDGAGSSSGNPWFICTHATAQALYLAQETFLQQHRITVSPSSAGWWRDVMLNTTSIALNETAVWVQGAQDGKFELAVQRMGQVADGFLGVSRRYTLRGEMTEQIGRNDGVLVGARNLTWSYASFIDAASARATVHDRLWRLHGKKRRVG